ncbi:MAG: zinc dependent phospholipase C family protein [Clostridia bacterium]|nr:zinc dependent phospholipase C family protein [Clostridia bacterium]
MAPWVMHLRIAELLENALKIANRTAYYVGSVAPDSGRMTGDFEYLPPKDVTHWKREGLDIEERIELNRAFYEKYVKGETDPARRAFYLGYYAHILADTLFVRDVIKPYIRVATRPVWRARIKEIRACWYEIDFRFVAEHPDYEPLRILADADDFAEGYLDYFAPGDIAERVEYIVELYANSRPNPETEFITIDVPGADAFVKNAAGEIEKLICG